MSARPLSLDLDDDLRAALTAEAAIEERSAEAIATSALRAYLDDRDAEREMIREAIAEADKGVFISGEAVDRWMASWGTENELPPPEPDVFLRKP